MISTVEQLARRRKIMWYTIGALLLVLATIRLLHSTGGPDRSRPSLISKDRPGGAEKGAGLSP
jgi:hypothetical protein